MKLVKKLCLMMFTLLALNIPNTVQAKEIVLSSKDMKCLVDSAYHESRGEGVRGMQAVTHVVLNRVKSNRFPNSVCAVIYQRNAFSWTRHKDKSIKEKEMYEKAKLVVNRVLKGELKDNTYGSNFFNSHHVRPKNTVFTIRIGNHSFYRLKK